MHTCSKNILHASSTLGTCFLYAGHKNNEAKLYAYYEVYEAVFTRFKTTSLV